MDMWFMPEAYDQYSQNIAHTLPVGSRKQYIGHPFDNRTKEMDVVSFVQNFQTDIWTCIAFVPILMFGLYLLQHLHANEWQAWTKACRQTFNQMFFMFQLVFNHSSIQNWIQLLPRRTFFLVPISLALFALNSTLQSLIKTEKVSMDNSFLLLTLEDVLRSDSLMMWMPVDRSTDLFSNAPNNTIYHKIWMKKRDYIGKTVEGSTKMLSCKNNCIGLHNLLYL